MKEKTMLKVGDRVVIVKGNDKRGKTGTITEIGGRCAGEEAASVLVDMKRCKCHTFFPLSYLAKLA